MTVLERFTILDRMNDLINKKGTGCPDAFAARLGIKRSCLFNYMKQLRLWGGVIVYDEYRESYYYVDDQKPQMPFIPKEDYGKLKGGGSFFGFFSKVHDLWTDGSDLCTKLTDEEEQNNAGSFGHFESRY